MLQAEAFSFDGVVLERDGHRILDGVSDHIHKAATTAVIGASGSGKSTFLRLLNRFEEPTRGRIRLDGQPLGSFDVHACADGSDSSRSTRRCSPPPLARRSEWHGPHSPMPTSTNSWNGSRWRTCHPIARRQPCPAASSKRVALARSLAVEPDVLLLAEPTSALDDRSAKAVDQVVRTLVADGLTVVLVSHDLERVVDLADTVLVLEQGRLVERGDPREVRYLS